MKKIIYLLVGTLFLLGIGTVSASTTFDTTWTGSGHNYINFVSGDDATNTFETEGNMITGEYHAIDYDNNPYGYSVDNTEITVDADVSDGWMEYQFDRTDSKTSMYGPAGQTSYSFLGSDDTASFAWRTTSNYASLKSSNWGFQSSNQFMATGNHYMEHSLMDGSGDGAGWWISANGDTQISHMSDEAHGSSFVFGKGCGCFTNAQLDTTGSGQYMLQASAQNNINTDTGISLTGSSTYSVSTSFTGGFSFGNFALSGN